ELLDAVVARIGDVDVPAPVGRHASGKVELSVARAAAPPRGEEGTARIELLDAVVARIGDVDVPAPVGRHASGEAELSVARAETPPRGEEGTARVELLDAGVFRIRGGRRSRSPPPRARPLPRRRHAWGEAELSVARAVTPPRGEEGTARIELLDAAIARIRDVDVPAPVGRHAFGSVELSVARA